MERPLKIHLLYSFLAHTILLSYLLSLPIYSGSANLKSFGDNFVYLRNEERKNVEKSSLTYNKGKKSETRNQGGVKPVKTVLKTKEVDAKENIRRLKAEKAIVSEVEPGSKKKETLEEKVAKALEVEKALEPAGVEKVLEPPEVEKPLKEETPELKEKEIFTKKEVHKTKEPEVKEETMKVFPPTEETKDAVKPIPPSALPQTDTGAILEAISENKIVPSKEEFKEETMRAEEAEEVVVTKRELGQEIKKAREEKSAKAVKVKKPLKHSGIEETLKKKTPAAKEKGTKTAKKEVREGGKILSGIEKVAETEKRAFPEAILDSKVITSREGFKEETIHVEDKEGRVAEILTPEKNRMLSQEEYLLNLDKRKENIVEEKTSPSGIPVSDILFLRDINIGFFLYPDYQTKKALAPATTELMPLPRTTEITNILLEESADIVKVRIKGNGSMTPNVFPLDNNRIVVDISHVVMNAPLPYALVSPLKGIRTGKHEGKVRIVLDLKEELEYDASSIGDSIVIVIKKLEKKLPLLPMAQKPEEKTETAGIKGAEMSNVSLRLLKKAHPMANGKNALEKQKEVNIVEKREELHIKGTLGIKRLLSVAKAERGIYTFVINNKGERLYKADVVFRLYERKAEERIKKFKTVELPPNTVLQFKFILPEAVFWDDEDCFTGTIESSNTLTKFNDKTGLIWKEEKGY